ncbi:MAG: outer membrane protein assembly factor BamA [Phycisphaeraceae bacterium]
MNRTLRHHTPVSSPHAYRLLWVFGLVIGIVLGFPGSLLGQGIDPQNRPIAEIRVEGLNTASRQLLLNQVRSAVGEPYDSETVTQDIVRLTHLGRFNQVTARVEPNPDGSVILIFDVVEQAVLEDVQVVGNKAITDQELLGMVLLKPGDPADPYLIEQGLNRIVEAYQNKGYFVADVSVDEELLQDSNILVYRVREGPRVKIKDIRFEGNRSFTHKQLKSKLRSKVYFPILQKGDLNREQLDLDAASLREFYNARGYLDAQVGRRIELSPDEKEAVVVFLIEEGPQYLVDQIRILPPEEGDDRLIPDAQIRQHLLLAPGDVYSQNKVQRSAEAVEDLLGRLGYLDVQASITTLPHVDEPLVDLEVGIRQGVPSVVGKVSITGNELTRQKVVLRQVRGMDPGRRFDKTGVDLTRRRITDGRLFTEGTVTILGQPGDETRDVLIDVTEATTGSVSFGAGISSDAGVLGAIDLRQRNFDITDVPQTPKELFTGRAFRGAGQSFALSLQPGDEVSRYSISFHEPSVLETDYSFGTSLFQFQREYDTYDEERTGGTVSVGRRFGDVWSANVSLRGNNIDISGTEPDVPLAVVAVQGDSDLTGIGFGVVQNTTDSSLFPTRGHVWEFNVERIGLLGGDYDFTKISTEFKQFWTVDEDFFGRRTVLSWRIGAAIIPEDNEAPFFERLYLGGQSTFRGFEFRGVGPRGIRSDTMTPGDDAVGGEWLLTTGVEYNFPIYTEVLRGVFFSDMGTLTDDPGIEDWRVSVGTGLRIKVPFFGSAPFALDLAVPVIKEDGDQTQVLSFSLDLPLR